MNRDNYRDEIEEGVEHVQDMLAEETLAEDPERDFDSIVEHTWVFVENSQTWRDETNHDMIEDECPVEVRATPAEQAARERMEETILQKLVDEVSD